MTIEVKRANSGGGGGGGADKDRIGVGMHVLAVDDNPTCLKLLETLLLKCEYRVTTTNQAVTALKLLRENRNKYDLVISDVNMPDMDGFKLLEHVGIEMDLPVIMLSAHGDKELVYKGVTHGAVDYLVKPVRIEELRNIWQHVIRRKKLCPKDEMGSLDRDKSHEAVGESGQGVASSDSADNNAKVNRKRKDQVEDDDEAGEENGTDNEEPGNQKKPRVVWSVDLHRKFVAAVNQLGFDKAVPKKILDIMNVDGLTRENVASHLQKYRLYLKRLSVGTTQQGNMVAPYGGTQDLSYLRMGSLDGFGDFRTLGGPGRISNTSLLSYSTGGMLGRLNSPAGLTLQGIANSSLLQAHSPTQRNSVNNPGKVQPSLLTGNQATTLLQGIPSSLEPTQLSKSTSLIGDFNCNDDSSSITLASTFPDARVTLGNQASNMYNASGNPLMLQVTPQLNQSRGAFRTQSSLSVPSSNHQPFDVGLNSSNILDHIRCNESWQSGTPSSKFPSSLQTSEPYVHDQLQPNTTRDNVSSAGSCIGSSPISYSASNALAVPLESSRVDMQSQAGLIGNVVKNINYSSKQRWEEPVQDSNSILCNSFGNTNSLVTGNDVVGLLDQGMDQRRKYNTGLIGQINSAPPSNFQHAEVERFALVPKMRSNEDYLLEQNISQNGFVQNNYESLDDLMNAMTKRDPSEPMFMEGDFGFNAYAL